MQQVTVIDWSADFVATLKRLLLEAHGTELRDVLILYPHQRPQRHLQEFLAQDPEVPKPLFLPEGLSINEWIPHLRQEMDPRPLRTVSLLDRAGMLFDIVQDLHQSGEGLLSRLPVEREHFYPWGVRLAELLEEFFRHGRTPANLLHLSGEVQPMAAALLEQLAAIHEQYEKMLEAKGWTTPGRDACFVASHPEELIAIAKEKQIWIAGFYALTGTENAIFETLWKADAARVVFHTDPAIVDEPDRAHWTCKEHLRWLKRWGAKAELTDLAVSPRTAPRPDIQFIEGFDLHSQLRELEKNMAGTDGHDTAVVVPDTSSLMPVLHHLPDKDINISMGYPLSHSNLHRLVDIILRLQETSQGPGRYYWRELINLLRHPYIKMLTPKGTVPLRAILREFEKAIRRGGKYLNPLEWVPQTENWPDDADDAFKTAQLEGLHEVLRACCTAFESVNSLAGLGDALLGVADVLLPEDEGSSQWHKFPIDAECLFRLVKESIPTLTDSQISHDTYSPSVLYSILRQFINRERVPFEAEPLSGLQIMGILESRLLRFSHVHILDATDDKLPGSTAYDPLLPEPLRRELGLPDHRHRSLVSAHNFHRLLAGAQDVCIYYRNGEDGAGALGGKSVRSRFVEELLWEEEKREGHLIEPGTGPVKTVSFPIRGIPLRETEIEKTGTIQNRLLDMLHKRSLSPSLLDSYLRCPVMFFYKYLTPLKPLDEVNEAGDPAELGTIVHDVLHHFFLPYRGKLTNLSTLDPADLQDEFTRRLTDSKFFKQMPWDMREGLNLSGRERLRRFLKNQGTTTILKLEEKIDQKTPIGDLNILLQGTLDRVDERAGGITILDYKTGGMPMPKRGIWTDIDFWDDIARGYEQETADDELLVMLAEKLPSLQLPLYAYLYYLENGVVPANAGWVELRTEGMESELFSDADSEEIREDAICEYTPRALRFVLSHMLKTPVFTSTPGHYCDWCPYGFACQKQ